MNNLMKNTLRFLGESVDVKPSNSFDLQDVANKLDLEKFALDNKITLVNPYMLNYKVDELYNINKRNHLRFLYESAAIAVFISPDDTMYYSKNDRDYITSYDDYTADFTVYVYIKHNNALHDAISCDFKYEKTGSRCRVRCEESKLIASNDIKDIVVVNGELAKEIILDLVNYDKSDDTYDAKVKAVYQELLDTCTDRYSIKSLYNYGGLSLTVDDANADNGFAIYIGDDNKVLISIDADFDPLDNGGCAIFPFEHLEEDNYTGLSVFYK